MVYVLTEKGGVAASSLFLRELSQHIMIKKQKGYSYASIMIALIVIQIISLTFVSTVVTTNNSTDKSNNTIIGTQLADSYLDFAEVSISNSGSMKGNGEAVNTAFQSLTEELDQFNAESQRFHLEAYFQCKDLCSSLSNVEMTSNDFPLEEDFIEVTISVEHKSSKVLNEEEQDSFHVNRLVVMP